jgi:hypothetical protein
VLVGNKPSGEPHESAQMEVYSESRGVLLPSVVDPAAIADAQPGLLVYNSSQGIYQYFDGVAWIDLPALFYSIIKDTDGDTYVRVDDGADSDVADFYVAGTHKLRIDTLGADLKSGKYLIAGKSAAHLIGQSVLLGHNSGTNITVDNSNVLMGQAAGSALSTGANSVLLGFNSGGNNNHYSNTIIGSSANSITGANNVFLGNNISTPAGSANNNVLLGYGSGTSISFASNNVLLGAGSGSGLVSGNNNLAIGNNLSLGASDINNLKIGNIITASSADGIVFNGAYRFPEVSGTEGQTLVLLADEYTLAWENAGLSPVDQTVIGSAAGMYTFDIGAKNSDIQIMQKSMIFVPLEPTANAGISKLMTWIKIWNTTYIQMAIYDKDFQLLSESDVTSLEATGMKTGFPTVTLASPVQVTSGIKYYIGIRFWRNPVADEQVDFAGSAFTGDYYFIAPTGSCPLDGTATFSSRIDFPADFSAPGGSWQRCVWAGSLPWVRAF